MRVPSTFLNLWLLPNFKTKHNLDFLDFDKKLSFKTKSKQTLKFSNDWILAKTSFSLSNLAILGPLLPLNPKLWPVEVLIPLPRNPFDSNAYSYSKSSYSYINFSNLITLGNIINLPPVFRICE